MHVRWGVLSTAKIGVEKVIPAMQAGRYSRVEAIASRNLSQAREVAGRLGISRAYGSYEELLADPEVDAVYIPLPNHLHVPWSLKALEAGKHVLCEKPIGLNAAEAEQLLETSRQVPGLKVMEAFMYRQHPQWQRARQLVQEGDIGELRTVESLFAYYNVDPNNIRNRADVGGGALMDIGCYCISVARWLFDAEPERVVGLMELDPEFQVDCLTTGILAFGGGTSAFTCGTQLAYYQRVQILGTEGRIEIEIPFNPSPDQVTRIWHLRESGAQEIVFDPVDHYTLQGDAFSLAVLEDRPVPTPLSDAVANMKAIEAVVRSARQGAWSQA
ncbi:MAG: gfo/Idh/MocA family oxidoreductase [Chloroflexi bacterium]|nr:MAG: gfo/Idh/MocA family oxidoreductase [Chloroflexota bacterium]